MKVNRSLTAGFFFQQLSSHSRAPRLGRWRPSTSAQMAAGGEAGHRWKQQIISVVSEGGIFEVTRGITEDAGRLKTRARVRQRPGESKNNKTSPRQGFASQMAKTRAQKMESSGGRACQVSCRRCHQRRTCKKLSLHYHSQATSRCIRSTGWKWS